MFKPFPKIPRLLRECVVTEKIDGTNGQVVICNELDLAEDKEFVLAEKDGLFMLAGSRNRFITPLDDNAGFARWVQNNSVELFGLGEGCPLANGGAWVLSEITDLKRNVLAFSMWGCGILKTYLLAVLSSRFWQEVFLIQN